MMRCAFVVVLAALATASQAGAQPTFDIVHAFGRGPTTPEGAMVETADGRLFGTTRSGGAFDGGTIFMVQRGADGSLPITLVHSFGGGSDGRQPRTGLILVDGALYGTTYFGGAHDYGTVFKMTLDGTFTAIHSFDGTEGAYPGALMRARDGLLYGVTETKLLPAGVNSGGTIFRISTAGAFTVIYVLAHSATGTLDDGATPRGPLVQAPDGTFYGVTESGGSWSDADFPLGTIFKLTEDGVFTRLHSFSANGFHSPQPGLILAADGSLYGATASHNVGGLQGPGAIFRRAPDGTVTFIHPFTTDANRWNPLLHFTEADGTIIGTTHTSVFRITTAGTLTTLRAFSFNEGNAVAALLRGGDGRLYGSSIGGSVTERGTVFGMTFAGELTGLNPFIVDDQPMQPLGALVPGADGSVFGITCRGGWLNAGTVYRRSAAGVVTTIKSFFILDGLCPFSLIRGADGFLYGTTLLGGANLRGTVFKISEAGAFTLLRTFSGVDGSYPDRLIQTANGQLWGTTYLPAGGQTDRGGIFRMSTTGALGAVFTLPPGCRAQVGPQVPNGAIYGTMRQCASNGSGTLFRMSESGVITTLFLFATNGAIGFRPAPLMLASDGNLYGTVEAANEGPGAIFVSTLSGQTTQIHAFGPGEGQMPEWGLIEGQDGLLYGTSLDPGSIFDPLAPDVGTVFSATKSGALTVLHKFSYAVTGGRPFGPLMQTPDGAIFGTTLGGGPAGQGTLFRITNEATGRW